MSPLNTIKVWSYIKKYKLQISVIIVFSIISMMSSIVVPYLNGLFIDILITTTSVDDIFRYATVIIIIGLLGTLASYYVNMSTAKLTANTSFDMLSNTINHIQKMPYETFTSKFNPAYLIQRVSGDLNIMFSFFLSNFMNVFLKGMSFVIITFVIALINIEIFFISLAFLPIYLICYIVLKKPLFNRNVEYKERQNHYSKTMFEQINRVQEIKAEATFEKSKHLENRSFAEYLQSLISFNRISYLFASLDGIIVVLFQSVVLVIGGIQIIEGRLTIGEFTIINTYFALLLSSVKYYFNLGKSYQDYKSSKARMMEIISIEEEHNGDMRLDDVDKISIEHVRYSYIQSSPDIIHGLNTEFYKGKISLITGPNGIGKTTLIYILLGILQNLKEGCVKYNDIDIENIDLYSTRKDGISTLIQRTNFPDSTLEGYLSDILNLDKAEIEAMIHIMELDSMYLSKNFNITEHWDSKVDSLSGGQKQRILLLKALSKRGSVLILDEPSTGLDDDGIYQLMNYLLIHKSDKITIIISHDEKFKKIADEIIQIGNT